MENELNRQQEPNETYQDLEENVSWENVLNEYHVYLEKYNTRGNYNYSFLEFLKANFKPPERK